MSDEKLSIIGLDGIELGRGSHIERENGVCAMEAVAWLAGESHSAFPLCACPVISRYVIILNDRLGSDERQLLKPYLTRIIGTRDGNLFRRVSILTRIAGTIFAPIAAEIVGRRDLADEMRAVPKGNFLEQKNVCNKVSKKLHDYAASTYPAASADASAADAVAYAAASAAYAAAAAADAATYAADYSATSAASAADAATYAAAYAADAAAYAAAAAASSASADAAAAADAASSAAADYSAAYADDAAAAYAAASAAYAAASAAYAAYADDAAAAYASGAAFADWRKQRQIESLIYLIQGAK